MPDKQTIQRARRGARQGKSPSTQAGEFVRDEIRKVRRGTHGVRSAKQAIAIGLSEARRAGVDLPPPRATARVKKQAEKDLARGRRRRKPSARRSRAASKALKKEPRSTVSREALARQAREVARRRGPAARSRSARKAAETRQHRRAA